LVNIIWEEFLKILNEEAGSQIVETWFKAVSLEKWNEQEKEITLKVPNQFVRNWIQEHYLLLIKKHLARLLHTESISISLQTARLSITPTSHSRNIIPAAPLKSAPTSGEIIPLKKKITALTIQKTNKRKNTNLNPEYQFDSFIVGPSNSLAHAAAYAVCQGLGTVYNPLFIYGGTGLGKTHLLHAIGNEAKKKAPKTIVRYVTSDHFMHEFITSIRFDKVHKFRERYQKVNLLLLDDIQFLSNKEQTQETFFHIFNALHQNQNQIVLSSDTFPKEITGLQNRLKSRMEWGLVADIQIPDLETKMAILKKKADAHNITLDDDVADFIASRIVSNIRALEGALVRVEAFSTLTNQPISSELARQVLINIDPPPKKNDNILLEKVLKTVAKHFSIPLQDLRSKKRQKHIACARQIAFYLMKKHTISSLQAIGNYIGGRDHSTVIHAIMKIEKQLEANVTLQQKVKMIEQDVLML
jgi:chromosomal replication initiator protein